MKITFGIIVLNGGFFLRQVLESIYPFAHAICIAEGPANWFVKNKGITTSTDDTNHILESFPDPDKKIKIVHGQYAEKDEQCQAWFKYVPTDTEYVFCVDADEVHTPENIEKLINYLEKEQPTSVGFKSDSFYGGFDRIIGGFERDHSFKRVLKFTAPCYYRTHRQPTLRWVGGVGDGIDIEGKDITGNQLYEATGITMWHGSYISPLGVHRKIEYYEGAVIAAGKCIPNYFNDVYLPWVLHTDQRQAIEDKWNGVQEFVPEIRGECKTIPFTGQHPDIIKRDYPQLMDRFITELNLFV